MNVIGISGLHDSVAFKRKEFPKLTRREYRIAQGFDSAAALVNSSGILAAVAEERFTGEKATGAFPIHAIQYCLEVAKLSHHEINYVAHGFSYDPVKSFFDQDEYTQRQYVEVYSPEVQIRHLAEHFAAPNWREKFVAVPHHLAHAASAYYPSGFDEALILVSDGMGEVHSMSVAIGTRHDVRIIKQIPALHSLGTLYGVFTLYLGFYMGLDEYKVMGLAPYGNPRRYYDKTMEFIRLKNDGTYTIPIFAHDQSLEERETHAGVLRFLTDQFGPAREPESEINQDHKDIAAALQGVLQTCQLHVLQHFKRETGHSNLCLAGGVALNCSANGVIKRSRLFQKMFIQPAAGDDGTALGAAMYAQRLQDPDFTTRRMSVPLWGPEFREEDIQEALAGRADCKWVKAESIENLCRETAARIDKGQIVAWYQGRMEFGPRALGSRSILADPRDPTMRDRINSLVKKREAFRPFAPVVTKEAAARVFDITPGDEDTYAHMLFVTHVALPYRKTLPAVTHVDGSARAQTVSREQNPRLWQLLNEFEKLSRLPVLLNTSFNVKGQPIVRTPKEALDTFLFASLDALVLGDYVVEARSARPLERATLSEPGNPSDLIALQRGFENH
jgi:carbamoyltransferase